MQLWTNYEEADATLVDQTAVADATSTTRPTNYRRVVVTECTPIEHKLHVAVQLVEDGARLETLMSDLRAHFASNPPARGAVIKPRRNEMVAAQFAADKQWYRAKIELVTGAKADIVYVDFGNRETVDIAKCLAPLPAEFANQPAGAKEFVLAFVSLKDDVGAAHIVHQSAVLQADDERQACITLQRMTSNGDMMMNSEYRVTPNEFITLKQVLCFWTRRPSNLVQKSTDQSSSADAAATTDDFTDDIGYQLVKQGYALVDARRERRFDDLVSEAGIPTFTFQMTAYKQAEAAAKRNRINIWQYGDFTGDAL